MTGAMIGFLVGLFVGGFFGVSTIALMIVASDEDDRMHDYFEKKDEGPRNESNDQSPTE